MAAATHLEPELPCTSQLCLGSQAVQQLEKLFHPCSGFYCRTVHVTAQLILLFSLNHATTTLVWLATLTVILIQLQTRQLLH